MNRRNFFKGLFAIGVTPQVEAVFGDLTAIEAARDLMAADVTILACVRKDWIPGVLQVRAEARREDGQTFHFVRWFNEWTPKDMPRIIDMFLQDAQKAIRLAGLKPARRIELPDLASVR